MKMKQECCSKETKPGISRRQAVSRLLQVVAGAVGTASIAGCPGGSTYMRNKLLAEAHAADDSQPGNLNPAGNLELNAADVPVNTALELKIAGKPAYLYHGKVDDAAVWYATSRVCTHMRCNVDFHAEAQEYNCPCHRSKYAVDGTVLKRPAKRDLQSWEVIANGDQVEIVLGKEKS